MKKFKYNQCGKNFAIGFNLKVQIQNVHEILLEKFFKVHIENVHKRFENTILMSVAKISHKILNWFNLNLKVHKEIVHDKDFEFNCVHCGKTFTTAFMYHLNHWIEITNYTFSINIFNCDQVAKILLEDPFEKMYEIDSWIELWTLWQKFH